MTLDEKHHGRRERRVVFLAPVEPLQANFPFARTILGIHATVARGKRPPASDLRCFVSSLAPAERSPAQWLELVRGHWGGVENRNHWRRDACGGEDRTRSRNPNVVGAVALLRNALLALIAPALEPRRSLPDFYEDCAHHPQFALNLIRRS